MENIYPFFIAFIMVFVAELGDKTQLLVLSFSNNIKAKNILFGVAIGSLFSHGTAIVFGSQVGLLENQTIHNIMKVLTYSSFILVGLFSLLPKKEKNNPDSSSENGLIQKISNLKINYAVIIALTIMIGELGDKTFLASIGFGIQYPHDKLLLILGAIFGMVVSDSIAIIFGKFLSKYISEKSMQKLSGILFLVFGLIGFIC